MRKSALLALLLLSVFGIKAQKPLQVILDAAPDNSTVKLAPGTYYSDYPLSLKGRTLLKVEGGGQVKVLCRDLFANVMEITDCKNVTISGIYFSHDKPSPEYECQGGVILVQKSQVVKIEDCEMEGSGTIGVHASNCIDLAVTHCNIHHNTFNAFYLNNCQEVLLNGNIVRNNANLMQVYGGGELRMCDNLITNNGGYWEKDNALPGPRIGKRDNNKPRK